MNGTHGRLKESVKFRQLNSLSGIDEPLFSPLSSLILTSSYSAFWVELRSIVVEYASFTWISLMRDVFLFSGVPDEGKKKTHQCRAKGRLRRRISS